MRDASHKDLKVEEQEASLQQQARAVKDHLKQLSDLIVLTLDGRGSLIEFHSQLPPKLQDEYSSLSGQQLTTDELFQKCSDWLHLPVEFVKKLRQMDKNGFSVNRSMYREWVDRVCTAVVLLCPIPIRDKLWIAFSFFRAGRARSMDTGNTQPS